MNKVDIITAPGFGNSQGIFRPIDVPVSNDRTPIIRQYLQVAWRSRWLIVAVVAAFLVLGLTITLLMTPRYSASATIEIARESGKILNVQGVEREASTADQEFYQTQYGLLESKTLAERVARTLRLSDNPEFYAAMGANPTGKSYQRQGRFFTPAGREQRLEDASALLLGMLDVSPVRGSRLVRIVFTTPDPSLSARLANSWASNFTELNLERRYEATSYARTFLEKRLAELRNRLELTERQLVRYAADQQVINLPAVGEDGRSVGAERSIVAETVGLLNQELARATADKVRAASRLQGGVALESIENVGISNLRQKRAEVAAEYARLTAQFQSDYPQVRQLASQMSQLDRAILREEGRVNQSLQTRYQEALARERDLSARLAAAKGDFLDQRQRSIQYNIFLREVDTNRTLYDGLLQRYKEIGVAGGIGVNNITNVDPAKVPERPSSPRLFLNLFIAGFLGLLAAVGAALLREHLSDTISDAAEIERKLGASMVGLVPKVRDLTLQTELADRKSPFVEAILAAQANLAMATQHGFPRSLAVTSSRQGEGKSSTTFGLAVAIARSGRRVLLIDADMRRPSLHVTLGRPLGEGLSGLLSGQGTPAEVIQPSGFDNLDCVLAGKLPPNAAELLSGNRLEQFINMLADRYDHILVDSPPVLGLADAPLIGGQVEGVVYVVEFQGLRAQAIRIALDRLRMTGANIFGIVLSKYDPKVGSYGYNYGYSYEYSYGRAA